nr:AbfB domain-containing protein [Actinocorallia herbida]
MESAGRRGGFLVAEGDFPVLAPVTGAGGRTLRSRATYTVVRGLAAPRCVSLRAADGRYLRHSGMRLRLSAAEATALFGEDATFCPEPGRRKGTVALRSHNYPEHALRAHPDGIRLDFLGAARADPSGSFLVRAPWAR